MGAGAGCAIATDTIMVSPSINPAADSMGLTLTSGELASNLRSSLERMVPTKGDELFGRAWKRGDDSGR